jgi:replicative DNA helicase
MVFIDYIGLVEATKGDSRVLEVDHIAGRARAIARNLDVAVVLASQLNRKIEDHGGRPRLPVMSDLRESGGIEQTADCVLILSRMPDENGEEANQLPLMACSVVKNRTGTTGSFQLAERFDEARFANAS